MTLLELKKTLQEKFTDFEWTIPPDLKMGILTTNEAFKQAQIEKVNPVEKALEIAEQIQNYLNSQKLPVKVVPTGPYINLSVSSTGLSSVLQNGLDYSLDKKDETIFIDFFSPNVGKEMHIGHMRSGNIGESLRRIFSLSHPNIITDNHIADCGIQFAILIWGAEHISLLKTDLMKLDWDKSSEEIIGDLNKIYVATNNHIESNPGAREEAQKIAYDLELSIKNSTTNNFADRFELISKIVEVNNQAFSAGESYLSLNARDEEEESPVSQELASRISDLPGTWSINDSRKPGQFDMVLGESFYQQFLSEIEFWYEQGLLVKDGDGFYADLEAEGLGRAYLISSKGYSVYSGRDVIARFVWAGLFGASKMISIADNRQKHSFDQAFTVIKKIVEAGMYRNRPFGLLSKEETEIALNRLTEESLIYLGFGFISLPQGVMSARKGTVIKFHEFASTLETEVDKVLSEKNNKIKKNPPYWEKVQKISAATIKWFDLSRDKNQDIVFNPEEMLSFEGNTGVYQLYTYARITNILKKSETTAQLNQESVTLLNDKEQELLLEMYTLPYILEQTISELKPHLIANHLISLTSKINSWYAAHSVAGEVNPARKDSLLALCRHIQKHLAFTLNLLGIEPLEQL